MDLVADGRARQEAAQDRARKAAENWSWELSEQDHHPISPPDGLDGLDGVEGAKTINTINAVNGTDVMVLADRGEQTLERHADLNRGVA